MHPYFNISKINILYYGCTRIISNGGGKLILHYTYNGVANTVTEGMGLSD